MPFFKSKPKLVEKDNEVSFRLECKYIGSQAVNVVKAAEQQRFVNEKLADMKGSVRGVSVVLIISTSGLKTFDRSQTTVKLAHAITKISSSTCNPEGRLFAYVARTKQSNGVLNMQAHIYRTKKTSHAQQLATFTSRAFKLAHAKATFVRESVAKSFDEEVGDALDNEKAAPVARRRWAKHELAKGHDYSEHASRARISSGALMYEQWKDQTPASPVEAVSPKSNEATPFTFYHSEIDGKSQNNTSLSSKPEEADSTNDATSDNRADEINAIGIQLHNDHVATESDTDRPESDFVQPTEDIVVGALACDPITDCEDRQAENGDVSPELASETDTDVPDKRSAISNRPDDQFRKISDIIPEDELLHASEWFQEGLTRELCEEALASATTGSFLVRHSQSTTGNYGMTLCCQGPPDVILKNFLISRLSDGTLQIQGCEGSFGTLTSLVSHYASTNDELPVTLRLAESNPLFTMDSNASEKPTDCNMNSDPPEEEVDSDPDYEHYCNSEIIMQELRRSMSI